MLIYLIYRYFHLFQQVVYDYSQYNHKHKPRNHHQYLNNYILYNIPEPSVGYKFFDASKKYPVILHIFDNGETSELSDTIDMKKMFTETEFDYGDYSMIPNMVLFRDDVYHLYANISGGTHIEDIAKYDDYVLENTFPCKRLPKTSCFAGKQLLVLYNNFYKIRL